jgi:hypothetical protein
VHFPGAYHLMLGRVPVPVGLRAHVIMGSPDPYVLH